MLACACAWQVESMHSRNSTGRVGPVAWYTSSETIGSWLATWRVSRILVSRCWVTWTWPCARPPAGILPFLRKETCWLGFPADRGPFCENVREVNTPLLFLRFQIDNTCKAQTTSNTFLLRRAFFSLSLSLIMNKVFISWWSTSCKRIRIRKKVWKNEM